ncbi:hypothetical protein GTR02_02735 [Kineococcus sp. R8]|uniref:hypothetical protein n=1 Tax=Kineococcus siccus TaxID=2696567 RepID=UPI001412B029|nr:hypothetical protein [Kineococcus siccus]NAZ80734.1 hypothetical protein [Kineococcus siccus]
MPAAPPRRQASTGAIAVVVAGIVAIVVSGPLFPLALVIAAVSGTASVRHLRAGGPDRGWWIAGVALAAVAALLAVFGAWVVLTR